MRVTRKFQIHPLTHLFSSLFSAFICLASALWHLQCATHGIVCWWRRTEKEWLLPPGGASLKLHSGVLPLALPPSWFPSRGSGWNHMLSWNWISFHLLFDIDYFPQSVWTDFSQIWWLKGTSELTVSLGLGFPTGELRPLAERCSLSVNVWYLCPSSYIPLAPSASPTLSLYDDICHGVYSSSGWDKAASLKALDLVTSKESLFKLRPHLLVLEARTCPYAGCHSAYCGPYRIS